MTTSFNCYFVETVRLERHVLYPDSPTTNSDTLISTQLVSPYYFRGKSKLEATCTVHNYVILICINACHVKDQISCKLIIIIIDNYYIIYTIYIYAVIDVSFSLLSIESKYIKIALEILVCVCSLCIVWLMLSVGGELFTCRD